MIIPTFNAGNQFFREVDGATVVFRKIKQQAPRLLRARKIEGHWVGANIQLSNEEILKWIRQDCGL